MFNVAKERIFKRAVKINVPDGDGVSEETLQATYRALDEEAEKKFDLATVDGTKEFLRTAIVRLDDVVGQDGETLTYSAELRDLVLGASYARVALVRTYFVELVGAREGN